MSACEHIEALLSGYLDGELTQQDRQRVDVHLDDCASCRQAFEQLQRIQSGLGSMPHPEPTEQQRSRMMGVMLTKTSRGVGWLLAIGGAALLIGMGVYEFVTDDSINLWVKIGNGAVAVAALLIGGSVLVERLRDRKTDRYKDVER